MRDIDNQLPAIVIEHDNKVHVINARVLRAIRDGQYLGDAVEMSQVLAVAVLNQIEVGR